MKMEINGKQVKAFAREPYSQYVDQYHFLYVDGTSETETRRYYGEQIVTRIQARPYIVSILQGNIVNSGMTVINER